MRPVPAFDTWRKREKRLERHFASKRAPDEFTRGRERLSHERDSWGLDFGDCGTGKLSAGQLEKNAQDTGYSRPTLDSREFELTQTSLFVFPSSSL